MKQALKLKKETKRNKVFSPDLKSLSGSRGLERYPKVKIGSRERGPNEPKKEYHERLKAENDNPQVRGVFLVQFSNHHNRSMRRPHIKFPKSRYKTVRGKIVEFNGIERRDISKGTSRNNRDWRKSTINRRREVAKLDKLCA